MWLHCSQHDAADRCYFHYLFLIVYLYTTKGDSTRDTTRTHAPHVTIFIYLLNIADSICA